MKGDLDAKNDSPSVRALERGLDVLDCFCQGETKLSLTEIAARINLNPSTATRILATLEKRNYLTRNSETKKYQLGSQILCLITPSTQSFDLSSVAAPYMRELFEAYNESVTLYVVNDNYRVCVARIETTHALRRVVNIGDRLPLTRGASGKVLLAWLPEDRRKAIWSADPVILCEELDKIRYQGYSISVSEREEGVAAVSAPIFDASNQVVAALAIAGPTARLTYDKLESMVPSVVQKAQDISRALGYKKRDT